MGAPGRRIMASLNAEEAPSEPGVVFNGRSHVPADVLIKIIKALNGIPANLLLLVPLTCQGFNQASRAAYPHHEIRHLLVGAIAEEVNEATKAVSARQRTLIAPFPREYREFEVLKDLEHQIAHFRYLIELEELRGDFLREEDARHHKEIRTKAEEKLTEASTHNMLHYLLKYGRESVFVRSAFYEQDIKDN